MTGAARELARLLPPLPGRDHDGYDWMDNLTDGWHPVASWGEQGWNLGSWPYLIVVHHDSESLYGRAVYVEGDLDIEAYATRTERDRATSDTAVYYWRHYETGPDLPAQGSTEPVPVFPPYND